MLRATPNVEVWRPCDTFETQLAWGEALLYNGPVVWRCRTNRAGNGTCCIAHARCVRGGYVIYTQ